MANDKPYYSKKPIASIDALAKTLGVTPNRLLVISKSANKSYTEFTTTTGKNKDKKRILHEPKAGLKSIQKKINREIFENVIYPDYLHGGLKERDYVTNVKFHAGSKTIIGLDIRNFYPSIQKPHVVAIFTKLCKFPSDVADILTDLVTLDGSVPQGACCSSYIANLIFFNSEYSLVSKSRARGLTYTRLLDDITISSKVTIEKSKSELIIGDVASLFTKFGLDLHHGKTKIEHSCDTRSKFEVTGLWAKHGNPKLRKKDRRYVRQLVFICEKEYANNPFCKDYHDLWNKTSGKVAVLTRLNHAQSKQMRLKLGQILPLYGDDDISKFKRLAFKLCQTHHDETSNPGKLKLYNKLRYHFGIVSRNDKKSAVKWKGMLDDKFKESAEKIRGLAV